MTGSNIDNLINAIHSIKTIDEMTLVVRALQEQADFLKRLARYSFRVGGRQ